MWEQDPCPFDAPLTPTVRLQQQVLSPVQEALTRRMTTQCGLLTWQPLTFQTASPTIQATTDAWSPVLSTPTTLSSGANSRVRPPRSEAATPLQAATQPTDSQPRSPQVPVLLGSTQHPAPAALTVLLGITVTSLRFPRLF